MIKIDANCRGVVGVYKPVGPTSHDMIDKLRRVTGVKKIGHAGTLDPLAEGVLVVGIGRDATKKLGEVVGKDKEYVAEVKLGATTKTDDSEANEVLSQVGVKDIPNIKKVKETLRKFEGLIWQTPPLYSAVKVKGKEAYKYARKGKEVELEPRKREVMVIEILEYKWPVLKLRVLTGKGVYIRSLARDIGVELGVGGYMKSLTRTGVGEFVLDGCFSV